MSLLDIPSLVRNIGHQPANTDHYDVLSRDVLTSNDSFDHDWRPALCQRLSEPTQQPTYSQVFHEFLSSAFSIEGSGVLFGALLTSTIHRPRSGAALERVAPEHE